MDKFLNNTVFSILSKNLRARPAREQRLIFIMCLVVVVSILWSWFNWQSKENTRLDRVLPLARTQLAAMQDASAEITRLRAQAKPAPISTSQLVESLQTSAKTLQLNMNIRSIDGSLIQVSGEGVNFDAWINWLAQIQQAQTLRLASADIGLEAKGVRIEVQLSTGR